MSIGSLLRAFSLFAHYFCVSKQTVQAVISIKSQYGKSRSNYSANPYSYHVRPSTGSHISYGHLFLSSFPYIFLYLAENVLFFLYFELMQFWKASFQNYLVRIQLTFDDWQYALCTVWWFHLKNLHGGGEFTTGGLGLELGSLRLVWDMVVQTRLSETSLTTCLHHRGLLGRHFNTTSTRTFSIQGGKTTLKNTS